MQEDSKTLKRRKYMVSNTFHHPCHFFYIKPIIFFLFCNRIGWEVWDCFWCDIEYALGWTLMRISFHWFDDWWMNDWKIYREDDMSVNPCPVLFCFYVTLFVPTFGQNLIFDPVLCLINRKVWLSLLCILSFCFPFSLFLSLCVFLTLLCGTWCVFLVWCYK